MRNELQKVFQVGKTVFQTFLHSHFVYHGDVLDLTGRYGRNKLRVGALFSVINEQHNKCKQR